jgi:outer membrane biosynthesis protein TonB
MFATVGREQDLEAGKRRLVAGSVTVGLCAAAIGGVALYGVLTVVKAVAPIADEPLVEVFQAEPELELPAAPPPPAGRSAPSGERGGDPEPQAEAAPPPPDEPTEGDANPHDAAPSGPPDAPPGGGGGEGCSGEDCGDDPTGKGGVPGGTGVRTVHHSELQTKRRVLPDYPEAARDLGLGEQQCKVRVFIDAKGVPYDLRFEACPKVFQHTTEEAVLKWRWYPAKVDGKAVPAQFLLNVTYKLN